MESRAPNFQMDMGDAEHRWTLNTHFFLFILITAIKGPERQYALNVYLSCPKSEVIFYTKYQYSLCNTAQNY
jgi:hypothetical protein